MPKPLSEEVRARTAAEQRAGRKRIIKRAVDALDLRLAAATTNIVIELTEDGNAIRLWVPAKEKGQAPAFAEVPLSFDFYDPTRPPPLLPAELYAMITLAAEVRPGSNLNFLNTYISHE